MGLFPFASSAEPGSRPRKKRRFQHSLYKGRNLWLLARSRSCDIEKLDPMGTNELQQLHLRGIIPALVDVEPWLFMLDRESDGLP